MSDVETIELSMEDAKEKIGMAEALDRLHSNPDFKKVFLNGYLTEYVIRQVELKAHTSMQGEQNQAFIDGQIGAIGHMRQFMNYVFQMGRSSKAALEADEAERDLAIQEEQEG